MTDAPTLNVADWVAMVILVVAGLVGWRRGLSGALGGLCGLAVAFVAGLVLYEPFGDFIRTHTQLQREEAAVALAYLISVSVSLVIMFIVSLFVQRLVRAALSRGLDALGGFLAGLAGGVLAVILAFLAANLWPHPGLTEVCGRQSVFGSWVREYVPPLPQAIERRQPADPPGDRPIPDTDPGPATSPE